MSWRHHYRKTSLDLSEYLASLVGSRVELEIDWKQQRESSTEFSLAQVGGGQNRFTGRVVEKTTPLGKSYHTVEDDSGLVLSARDVRFLNGHLGMVYNNPNHAEYPTITVADWRVRKVE